MLRSRYNVGEAGLVSTTAGRTIAEEALRALSPQGTIGVAAFCALALAGVVQLARERPRVAVLLITWVAIPIVFFSAVPAETRFFGRYVLPALPAFLILVVAGCRLLGRRLPIVAALVVLAVAVEGGDDVERLNGLHGLDLRALPTVPRDAVLFSSTGSPRPTARRSCSTTSSSSNRAADRVEELPAIDPRYDTNCSRRGRGVSVHSSPRAIPDTASGSFVVSLARVTANGSDDGPRGDGRRASEISFSWSPHARCSGHGS